MHDKIFPVVGHSDTEISSFGDQKFGNYEMLELPNHKMSDLKGFFKYLKDVETIDLTRSSGEEF